jgi:predicted Rossmann fold flavoprotein
MMVEKTVVIGGGAAGLMAAISAAGAGERVDLLEGNPRLGRKILISGNGRCNLTNLDADAPWHYHGGYPGFVRSSLERFALQQTLDFFTDLGIDTHAEKRGRLFPLSNQAQAVVELLVDRAQCLGVEIHTGAKVRRLQRGEDRFRVIGQDGREWMAERVILASGGRSLPKLGADTSGLDLALSLGHSSTSLHPGLVPLLSSDPYVPKMQGVKVQAEVRVSLPGGREIADRDDLLLTAYGVSGFTILNLSAQLVPLLDAGPVVLQVNLFPEKSSEQVSEELKRRWERNPHRSLEDSFWGLLANKLVGPFLERFDLPRTQRVDRLGKKQRWRLAQALTCWPIEVTGPRSYEHAEVTIGGVCTGEVDPETLESYLVPGLYFAGEILDVHGDLGGFNFQWAWSSGRVAGMRLGS